MRARILVLTPLRVCAGYPLALSLDSSPGLGGAGVLLLLGSSGFFWRSFWRSSGGLLAFFWRSITQKNARRTQKNARRTQKNARRTQKNARRTPEEPRRTQKEKNTSPPALAMFAAALKRLGAFSRLNTPLKATISTKHKKEQTKIQSGRRSMK